MSALREYVGDSVYAEFDDDVGQLILKVSNGIGVQSRIVIEPEVWKALSRFVATIQAQKNCPPIWRRKRSEL